MKKRGLLRSSALVTLVIVGLLLMDLIFGRYMVGYYRYSGIERVDYSKDMWLEIKGFGESNIARKIKDEYKRDFSNSVDVGNYRLCMAASTGIIEGLFIERSVSMGASGVIICGGKRYAWYGGGDKDIFFKKFFDELIIATVDSNDNGKAGIFFKKYFYN